ncbi:MAG: hypothetical protein QOH55_1695 [Microbacteriaceae bacterium]|jgi:hypothetical protein|nr:hypothetical protein [Microbacteriaceae bacterium]
MLPVEISSRLNKLTLIGQDVSTENGNSRVLELTE